MYLTVLGSLLKTYNLATYLQLVTVCKTYPVFEYLPFIRQDRTARGHWLTFHDHFLNMMLTVA